MRASHLSQTGRTRVDPSATKPTTGILSIFPTVLRAAPTSGCFLPNSRHKGAATDHHNCVVDRIEIFKQVLSDNNALRDDRIEALKFLVHFVGGVHQPFHAIGEAAGGNPALLRGGRAGAVVVHHSVAPDLDSLLHIPLRSIGWVDWFQKSKSAFGNSSLYGIDRQGSIFMGRARGRNCQSVEPSPICRRMGSNFCTIKFVSHGVQQLRDF